MVCSDSYSNSLSVKHITVESGLGQSVSRVETTRFLRLIQSFSSEELLIVKTYQDIYRTMKTAFYN